jgi:hypothetical protein
MRVLEKHEPALSNHCVLCGHGLDRERQDIVIDVGYDFDLPGHQLDGRKFVCQGCVFDIGKAAGLLSATQLNDAKSYLRKYRTEIDDHFLAVSRVAEALVAATQDWPGAPNLDHLDTPAHVLVAEQNATVKKRAKKETWTEPVTEDPPF